jgi:3-deoxy-D-manno-octulosonic-acid transferase
MLLNMYKTAMGLSAPILALYLKSRASRGKEDPARAHERRGAPLMPRPSGMLVWCHAASVGESISLLSVVEKILSDYPHARVMVTTGSVTSAGVMASRLPTGAFHQYIPVDHPEWVEGFLNHWKPDVVLWSESELWPNMLSAIRDRAIPAVLLNARMSEKTYRRWLWVQPVIARILSVFDLCLAQNAAEARRLNRLGARMVRVSGNLKYAAVPLPVDRVALQQLSGAVGARPVVLWASTHKGEERIAAALHNRLKNPFPDLLTIIAPRHPVRGEEIANLVLAAGLSVALRSKGDAITPLTDIYLADTIGEMGLLYALCRNVVVGGTFADVGGHNPIEPAQAGCLVFFGPVQYNFITIMEDFRDARAVIEVASEQELEVKLLDALRAPGDYAAVSSAARELTLARASVLDEISGLLHPYLEKAVAA